jgi:predicted NBD/HSP70 family sugar kinase
VRKGTNLPLVAAYNQNVVLEAIRSSATASRVELVGSTGLTPATVTNIVRRLIREDLVIETGWGESTGGKRRTMLKLNPVGRFAVGVLLDTHFLRYVVMDLGGAVVARRRGPGAGTRSLETVTAEIAKTVRQLVRSLDIDSRKVVGLGVAAPGPLRRRSATTLRPPNLAMWDEEVMRGRLQDALGFPVFVDNDANAAALGEWWLTEIQTERSFVCVYMGDGIGAGIVFDGVVYRGATLNAGEMGHVSVDPSGPTCHCGNRGCLEMYSSPRGIVDAARKEAETHGFAALGISEHQTNALADLEGIKEAARRGSAPAEQILQRSVDYLTMAVLGVVNLLDIELVVLAGHGFLGLEDRYVGSMRHAMEERAFARDLQVCQVRMSRSVEDGGAAGAASLAMYSIFSPHLLGVSDSSAAHDAEHSETGGM